MFICLFVSGENEQNARHNAQGDVARHNTINHACFSVKSAVPSVCVYPLASMGIRQFAPATTTGRPRREDPNALRTFAMTNSNFLPYRMWDVASLPSLLSLSNPIPLINYRFSTDAITK